MTISTHRALSLSTAKSTNALVVNLFSLNLWQRVVGNALWQCVVGNGCGNVLLETSVATCCWKRVATCFCKIYGQDDVVLRKRIRFDEIFLYGSTKYWLI